MPIRAVLFDFDGTLADSFGAIAASTNHVRQSYGLPSLPESVVREYVGYGLAHLMAALVPNADPEEAVARYRGHHPTIMASGTRLMPGVAATIPELHRRGYRLAVCSNKRVEFTRSLVVGLHLDAAMWEVLGPEDVAGRAKPDPAMLLEALARLGVARADAVYIGDMAIDVQAARAAAVPVWLVLGGVADLDAMEAAAPDRILTRFDEILDLLPERD